jgi:hypothetical protein
MYDALERLPDVEVSPAAPAMYVVCALDSHHFCVD